MNFDFILGRYIPTESIFHRMDPRLKILFCTFAIASIFLLYRWTSLFVFSIVILSLLCLSKINPLMILKSLKAIWILLLLAFVLHLFDSTGRILFEFGFLTITEEGIIRSFLTMTRLILLIWVSLFLTSTTSPLRIADTLESILKAIRLKREYAHEIAMIMSIAIRFIPVIYHEANKIMMAQKSRGMRFDGHIIGKIKSFFPLIIPLLTSAFKRADELALAMDVRYYRGYEGRTKYFQMEFTKTDFVLFGIITGVFSLILINDRMILFA